MDDGYLPGTPGFVVTVLVLSFLWLIFIGTIAIILGGIGYGVVAVFRGRRMIRSQRNETRPRLDAP